MNIGFANDVGDDILMLDTANAPGGIMAYYADGDEEIIHANSYVIELCSCSTFEEFLEFTGGTFRGFVHESEIDQVEESIWMQVQERRGFDHVYYHVETKSGRLLSIDDYGRLIEREGERPVFYVFLAEVDRQEARDWLTGLPELPHFKHLVALEALGLHGDGEESVIVVFDLMGMKGYNATYGREGGDVLLRGFADVLRRHFNPDACCRHAGDRFFAFAPSDDIGSVIDSVFRDFAASGIEGVLPVMAGACMFYPGDDVSTVLDRARLACDSDNTTWKSHLTWFNEEMRTEAELRVYVLEHLDQAIANRWLRPYYQPIMRASTGDVCCEEALARWVDPNYGTLAPNLFIPVLERAGLLQKLDMHMVDCVIEDFATKREVGMPITAVSVNISLSDLGSVDIAHEIVRKMREADLPPGLLKVEFTESTATDNPEQLRSQIKILHEAGFSVWMDDFGSGFSSLNILGEFDFDLLKLDMELVRNIGNNRSQGIIAGIVEVTRKLGMGTLAEGVETPEQAKFLKAAGCGMLQGYLYAKPNSLDYILQRFNKGLNYRRESLSEFEYWNAIALFDIDSPISSSEDWSYDNGRVVEFPVAIIEHRGKDWNIVRANRAYDAFLVKTGGMPADAPESHVALTDDNADPDFLTSIERTLQSGTWERVAGQLEYGTGLQFFTKHIASTPGADAFVNASVSTMLGSALGVYGDVPIAYAVFRVVLNEAGDGLDDMEFVYANGEYCDYASVDQESLPGRRYLKSVGEGGRIWLPYCYRSAVLKEKVQESLFVHDRDEWIVFSTAPASVDGCCSFVFFATENHPKGMVDVL